MKVRGVELGIPPLATFTVDTTLAVPPQVPPLNQLYVTVPPDWKPPVIAAESDTEPPTVIGFAERVVLIVGLALLTVSGSQGLVMALLFASPLYAAFQLYEPALLNPWGVELGTTPFVTLTGDPTVVAVPVHEPPLKNT